MTINIIFASIPYAKASVIENEDGSYSIIVSKALSREQAKKEVVHELTHIVSNDFNREIQANMIEEMIRRSDIIPEAEGIEFYCQVV